MQRRKAWTKKDCLYSARQCKTRTEWITACRSAYQAARIRGWLDECCAHMTPLLSATQRHITEKNYNFNFSTCLESAKQFKTLKEWERKNPMHYARAFEKDWLCMCTLHMDTTGINIKQPVRATDKLALLAKW